MTLIEELTAAAQTLRDRAAAATPGPWHRPLSVRNKAVVTAALPEGEIGRYLSGETPEGTREQVGVVMVNTWSDGRHVRKRGGRDLEWIALAHPGLGTLWADLLSEAATLSKEHKPDPDYDGDGHQWCGDCQVEDCGPLLITKRALAIARAINGGAT